MRLFKTEGIIIKRRNYGEADRLLTVLTKNTGKIQVKATGIRKITSRRSPHVELLNHSVLGLYRGRSYPILTECETIDNFSPIKNSLEKIGHAFHLCELVDCLCPENQENTKVFFLLKNILINLSLDNPVSIREFEIELLIILGYLPAGRQGWNNPYAYSYDFDTNNFIENIIERKLKSRDIFAKL
ncbi:DNA repair protein RecO, partial [Patescibacteria group bacterium]|nr:DNA repair protein RecO [Patescibacteria group bacterium]